ncbi:centromere-associated protein E-like isoform X1 [Vanessa cardui]|uniref:centromere-associated protein E-like isoform X1 n=1 Tax=Vanessa cardui TaxID=171605 RepID=UPI001F1380D9|nr:centromere-associated protein E-like isoform X1 [Vanessa cardui]
MSDNIKVVVKVRPLISREIDDKLGYQWRVNNNTLYQIDQNGKDSGQYYTFDKVYDKDTKTCDVYNDIAKPIVEAATAGFNGTIFAYGQTSSGKTYTMAGTNEAPGIIPLAVFNLFDIIKNIPDRDFLVRVSYVEIYNETLTDLLDLRKNIKIMETLQGVKVDATEKMTTSPEEVLEVMRMGKVNRQTGATNMNEESSRSHSIFQITIESREHIEGEEEVGSVNVSQLNLVDLAGSERSGQTGATGIRFKEGTHINKSLSSLALVIKQLSEDPNKHVNYRDSKLTRILQNSLGGNAKTSIICAVTPAAVEETISTLQFANRAKAIKNNPAVNAVATNVTMIQTLTKQLSALKTQLESKKNVEQDNYNLQKQIGGLQRLILNGFAQRSSTDITGARRKLQQPRRVTISTLHPIQEDPVPSIPKFCTPSLKYNPMSIASTSDFVPIQNVSSLPSVSEELRLITPPPTERNVNFNNEIIEIDSDDDNSTDIQTCSPYHKCYQSSKTPPCVLRKNAKLAEKNFKDIVELTEREKIYTPNIVELMEKLESKSTRIAKLEDEIHKLGRLSNDKDLEMERLKCNINKMKDEIKNVTSAKADLEEVCKNYNTKLTDWEVSYETLKKKAKTREDELLSLLQEHEAKKKYEKIGKLASKSIERELTNFMDMSRDISLVNSDIENSIINIEEGTTFQVEQPKNNEFQLSIQDQTILDLQSELQSHKSKIDSLETINKELQEIISSYKEKLTDLKNENSLHISTIDKLNNNIESQKTVLETINADIDSYNSVIQELQIKLAKKENVTENVDSEVEAMIIKEEMFIANNENIKNIIMSLKAALYARNEEIKELKSSLDTGKTQEMNTMEEELENKKKEISILIQEVERLKTQSNENVSIFDKLLEEKNNLLHMEQHLQIKNTEIQKEKELLEEKIAQHIIEIKELENCKEKLNIHLEEKDREILSIKESKDTEIRTMSAKIIDLEENIKEKDEIITSLQKHEIENQENLNRVQSNIDKFNNIMVLFTGNILAVPEKINDLVSALNTLSDNLSSLETIATDTIAQKKHVVTLLEQRETELELLQSHINDLSDAVDCFYKEYESLTGINHRNGTYSKDSNDMQNINTNPIESLKSNVTNLLAVIKLTQISINQTLRDKEKELHELNSKCESKEVELENECDKVTKYMQEIEDLTNERDNLLQNILEKTTELTSECSVENTLSCQFSSNPQHVYEQIILTLDKIGNHISILNSEREAKYDNIESTLSEAKNEIMKLTEENIKLIQDITNLESSNKALSSDIKKIQDDSKSLTIDLQISRDLLNQMQQDLTAKSSEIELVEAKAVEWKDKFENLEVIKKKQIEVLRNENIELKSKFSGLQLKDRQEYTGSLKSNQLSTKKSNVYTDINSPPSLLKICCESIIDAFSPNEEDETVSSTSSSIDEIKNSPCLMKICQCEKDLDILKDSNIKLMAKLKQLEDENEYLNKEREEVQKEVQLLVENIYELQKKIVNHRTNLSTLTATTYAENRSLSSQVKFLQHHHNRFHIVCQRDIPDFKNQLQDLLILLKSESLGKLNESLKRYSLPNALETVALHSPLTNESMIDGDLLMLDTNVTLTTCDNTLISHDQTCFDVTQVCTYNEVACQTNLTEISKSNLSYPQMNVQSLDETKISKTIESLKKENQKLRDVVDEYLQNKKSKCLSDAQSSPIKISVNCNDHINNSQDLGSCSNCTHVLEQMKIQKESYESQIELMTNKMTDLESQKVDFETKYQNLSLEIPSSELLVRKLGALEKDNGQKQNEIDKLNSTLDKKSAELKTLQKENDLLSNQIFESISEVDDLKKEHDLLKEININLNDKFAQLESEIERLKYKNSTENQTTCMECTVKNEIISNLKSNVTNSHQKLDRSYSDSDSSSRYNKICTLQNELHAGKEDCIELKEQVTTIKNHLERSNLSMGHAMDLDDSIVDSHICSFNEDFDGIKSNINKYNMPDIPEERPLDNHTIDKLDCFNFYLEKTAADKNTINYDGRIIDVMKMLYETIENKHANEIENLNNKLKDFEESKTEFQMQLNKMSTDQTRISKELKEKDTYFETLANVVSQIRHNIESIKSVDFENTVNYFSDNVLMKVDKEFGFTSTEIFKFIIQQITEKQRTEITKLATDNDQLNITLKQKSVEIQCLQDNLSAIKLNLTEKENNLDHLQRQKEKIHEISAAVTLDIVTRDKVLKDQVIKYYEKLLESKIIDKNVDMALPVMEIINSIFEVIFNNHVKLGIEKQALYLKIDELKEILDIKENKLKELNVEFEDLKKMCNKREEEHSVSATTVSKLTEDICALKADIANKDALITSLKSKFEAVNNNMAYEVQVRELLQSTAGLQQEIDNLKSINDVILKEKKTCEEELENASAIIKQNKIDIEKLASDILLLKDTINKNSIVIENMKTESERLLKENTLIKNQLDEKCKEYSRMEDNIKKHQKTAEIQSGIIIRLKKQKQDDETLCLEKNNQIDKLTENCKILETRGQELANELLSSKEKIDELLISKQLLETRISELEANANTRPRLSIDAMADTTRRRRQSIHDSKRLFSDDEEHLKMEAVFKCSGKVDDLFMDVDENASNRSTPIRLSRGRDSLPLNHDQGERDERPERAQAARRRRQSAHDLRRAAHDNSRESSQNNSMESEVTQLRKQLSSCQQELEELKDKYRELDEECETCAEYLKERDEQCLRLKKEKVALEKTVAELKEKLTNTNPSDNTTNVKNNLVNASVKTDEDWVNLHSVVVDRMSYDMEVEKNKKLMKTVEELRFNKHDLKKTIAKMQKALEKNNVKDSKELETMKAELSACKQELEELKVKYKELDEECETCAEYLRERDEQCRKLKEVKASLELKLQEYHDLSNITHSVRKKRQNLHDKNRTSSISLIDAATLTDDDLLRYHVEKNTSSLRPSDDTHAEIRRLKSALEKLSQQKVALEHQLLVASANPLYVATGSAIIQNQQLTDVMKENQKLKKINAKLVTICKKRGKGQTDANRENEDPLNN